MGPNVEAPVRNLPQETQVQGPLAPGLVSSSGTFDRDKQGENLLGFFQAFAGQTRCGSVRSVQVPPTGLEQTVFLNSSQRKSGGEHCCQTGKALSGLISRAGVLLPHFHPKSNSRDFDLWAGVLVRFVPQAWPAVHQLPGELVFSILKDGSKRRRGRLQLSGSEAIFPKPAPVFSSRQDSGGFPAGLPITVRFPFLLGLPVAQGPIAQFGKLFIVERLLQEFPRFETGLPLEQ
jgi:hypothetical protein